MNIRRLDQILEETTFLYRKGEEVVTSRVGNLQKVEIFSMPRDSEIEDPEAAKDAVKVDVHFMVIVVSKSRAEEHRQEFLDILREYPEPVELAKGPSYVVMGAHLGDQTRALRIFALGEALGLWKVITPAFLGITGAQADEMAGNGLVMMTGLKE